MLLDGKLPMREMDFQILADDLPRKLRPEWLPSDATRRTKQKVDWAAVSAGGMFLFFAVVVSFLGISLYEAKPSSFPWPWEPFSFAWPTTVLLFAAATLAILIGLLGVVFLVGIGLDGVMKRSPRFPLPEELRGHGYRLFSQRLIDYEDVMDEVIIHAPAGVDSIQKRNLTDHG